MLDSPGHSVTSVTPGLADRGSKASVLYHGNGKNVPPQFDQFS
jgi:hypothetical protein